MTMPSYEEIQERIRAAVSADVFELGTKQWTDILLDPEDHLSAEEQHGYLLLTAGHAVNLLGLAVKLFADALGRPHDEVLAELWAMIPIVPEPEEG